ncbi:MAG: MTH1187 family thiamine-binding protein [Desulfocapsaceae bacterium]
MKVIADLTVSPFGVGLSVSKYIAACHRIFEEAGLKTSLHAYGTNIEGDWDAVMAAIKKCHEELHRMEVPRITSSIKIGTRTDKEQSMADKVASVNNKLG